MVGAVLGKDRGRGQAGTCSQAGKVEPLCQSQADVVSAQLCVTLSTWVYAYTCKNFCFLFITSNQRETIENVTVCNHKPKKSF